MSLSDQKMPRSSAHAKNLAATPRCVASPFLKDFVYIQDDLARRSGALHMGGCSSVEQSAPATAASKSASETTTTGGGAAKKAKMVSEG